jgi:hypothetical protein
MALLLAKNAVLGYKIQDLNLFRQAVVSTRVTFLQSGSYFGSHSIDTTALRFWEKNNESTCLHFFGDRR